MQAIVRCYRYNNTKCKLLQYAWVSPLTLCYEASEIPLPASVCPNPLTFCYEASEIPLPASVCPHPLTLCYEAPEIGLLCAPPPLLLSGNGRCYLLYISQRTCTPHPQLFRLLCGPRPIKRKHMIFFYIQLVLLYHPVQVSKPASPFQVSKLKCYGTSHVFSHPP
jgi:hypothetical protein